MDTCYYCGDNVLVDDAEVAYHYGPDGIDHDADADHVAVPETVS